MHVNDVSQYNIIKSTMSSFYEQILFNRTKDQLPMFDIKCNRNRSSPKMQRHIWDLSTVQSSQFEKLFNDKGTKIQWRKIAKQGVRFAPLQKLGTLPIRFTRAFSEEELRNHLRTFLKFGFLLIQVRKKYLVNSQECFYS